MPITARNGPANRESRALPGRKHAGTRQPWCHVGKSASVLSPGKLVR